MVLDIYAEKTPIVFTKSSTAKIRMLHINLLK